MSDQDGDYGLVDERLAVDEDDYGLDTDEGNARVQAAVRDVVTQVQGGEVDRAEAVVLLSDAVEELSANHPEVTDITPRTRVIAVLDPVFVAQGWERLEPYEF